MTSIITWIPIIAAVFAIVEALFGPVRSSIWPAISEALGRRSVRLPWSSTRRALDRIVRQAKDFHPEVIVGINRGGAIVGGMIAKKLRLEPPILLNVDQKRDEVVIEQRNEAKWKKISGRILLCDDACRTRDTLTSAVAYLREHAENPNLRPRATIT